MTPCACAPDTSPPASQPDPLAASAEVRIDTPRGGWREGSGDGAHFMQQVNYPASSVNVAEDQADTARIKGAISGLSKAPQGPGRLVVNGIDMPLKINEDGGFDRPFVFPAGSNSVEVQSPDGQQKRRVQFYSLGRGGFRRACAWCCPGTATTPTWTCTW